MGWFHEFFHMEELLPKSIKFHRNEETGVEVLEIINRPNKYAPERNRFYTDKKRGIEIIEMGPIKKESKNISKKGA